MIHSNPISLLAKLRSNQIHEVNGNVADGSQCALQTVRNQKTFFVNAADEVFEVLDKCIDCVVAGKLCFEFRSCWDNYIGGQEEKNRIEKVFEIVMQNSCVQ